MTDLKEPLWNTNFSHIYVQEDMMDHPITQKVLNFFKKSRIIRIHHYKDIFCRGHQNFQLQKKSIKLILCKKEDHYLYEGAKPCENFGNHHFYYTSSMMNCMFNCSYCYLQGMYPSGNMVLFINLEDTFKEIIHRLNKHPMYVCISYDTDLLAMEKITGFIHKWIDFVHEHKDLKIELRTKSDKVEWLRDCKSSNRFILAFTLSPQQIIDHYEKGTPSLDKRIRGIKKAIELGYPIRLCFDPLLYIKNFKGVYGDFIQKVFENIPPKTVQDVSIGVFRVSKDYFKKMYLQKDNPIFEYPFMCENSMYTYKKEHTKNMIDFVYEKTKEWIEPSKIYR